MPAVLKTVQFTAREVKALDITTSFIIQFACNNLADNGLSKRDLRGALKKLQAA